MPNHDMNIVNFIDSPDPDNFVQVLATAKFFPDSKQFVCLTGRPTKLNKSQKEKHPNWHWDLKDSRITQNIAANRIKHFLQCYGISNVECYDGGIAPRTLVPHHIHFEDYYKFGDVDPIASVRHSDLKSQESLVEILSSETFWAVVGGPMTGMKQVAERNPQVSENCQGIFSMFATWGKAKLMNEAQFNVACDPFAAYSVLKGWNCPIYMIPTECTKHEPIGFEDNEHFRSFMSDIPVKNICDLYDIWYNEVLKPQKERIYIHDVCSALAMYDHFLFDPEHDPDQIYEYIPVSVEVPHLTSQKDHWGKVILDVDNVNDANVFCATKVVDSERYLQGLKMVFKDE